MLDGKCTNYAISQNWVIIIGTPITVVTSLVEMHQSAWLTTIPLQMPYNNPCQVFPYL